MKSLTTSKLFLTLGVVSLCACAHNDINRQIDAKLEKMPAVETKQNLTDEAHTLIASDSKLSAEQKSQLTALQSETTAHIESLWQKSAKLRAILIKDLVAPDYNEGEVEIIKDRMRTVEDQRLETIFGAVKKANIILNKQATNHTNFMKDFFRHNQPL